MSAVHGYTSGSGSRRTAGVRRAASESAASRNRARSRSPTSYAQVPEDVASKDVDGPMTLTEVCQFVRDLCLQSLFDRAAWQHAVAASIRQANRLEALKHEALQTNDDVSGIVAAHMQIVRESE